MFAYDFPLLSAIVVVMFFFLWVVWIVLLIRIVSDLFRSDDLSGAAKGAWLVFLVFFPYLGVLSYVFARGDKIAQNELARAHAQEAAMASYVRSVAGDSGGGVSGELARLADLRQQGVLSEDEFAQQKAKLLG